MVAADERGRNTYSSGASQKKSIGTALLFLRIALTYATVLVVCITITPTTKHRA